MTEVKKDAAILLLDIDQFKSINDRFGHAVGDNILVNLAQAVRDKVGKPHVARWGGEEFLVLLQPMQLEQAYATGQVILQVASEILLPDQQPLSVSIGLACRNEIATLDAWVDLADKRMYEAKRQGGNRIIGPDEPSAANTAH